jgi:N-acetylglutamate synthase-like GNAT family acetyltransferase
MMIEIRETDDYSELVRFFIENELEFTDEDIPEDGLVPENIVKQWKAVDSNDGSLVGGCVLAKREGHFICDGIATDPKIRGQHIGKKMLTIMLDEAKSLGADELYLVARRPGFYSKYGFKSIPREAAPNFFECFTCPQYGVSCHPEVMQIDL